MTPSVENNPEKPADNVSNPYSVPPIFYEITFYSKGNPSPQIRTWELYKRNTTVNDITKRRTLRIMAA